MEFTCCLNMAFTWKPSRRTEVCLHDLMRQNVAAWNEHFVHALDDVNVVSGNDVFDVRFCKPTPFCATRFKVLTYKILLFKWFSGVFGAILVWNQVKCKNNDTRLFQCINILPGPSEDVWTLGLTASCSNNFLGILQMLMHKNLYNPFIQFIHRMESFVWTTWMLWWDVRIDSFRNLLKT